jgi:aspartate/methionine/tyrosine aminotransferase
MPFFSRVRGDLEANVLSLAVERRRADGSRLWDLTLSNPTLAGLDYPLEEIRDALAQAARHPYQPDPRGLPDARRAVAEYYRGHGKDISPESILLTSGTSEAYSYLFKLLCSPGESVLFPRPSYPLVEVIAGLEGVSAHPYPLAGNGRSWDISRIGESLPAAARALVAVSPNNPTGAMLTEEALLTLGSFGASHGLALIVDEVFLDYPAPGRGSKAVTSAGYTDVLTFTLGGLSKACGLPQMKLAWIAAGGPEGEVRTALAHLEFISDAFLTTGTPVQQSAAELLTLGARIREQIRRRIDRNEETLWKVLGDAPGVTLFPRDGGWYAVVDLSSGAEDEEVALRLLAEQDVIVQPGYLFDFEDVQTIILSLLPEEECFSRGVEKIRAAL